MSRQELTNRCSEILGWLGAQVTIANSAGLSDISVVSETLMQNLLNAMEDGAYKNTNLDAPNADSIDLADELRKHAVQITSNTTAEKIRKTIKGFQKHKHHERYTTLRFLFLSPQYRPDKKKYSIPSVALEFDDLGKLALRIRSIQDAKKLQAIVEMLEDELAPWSTHRKVLLKLSREKANLSETYRIECRLENLGELSAENVQLSVATSDASHISVIPKGQWTGIPGSGTAGVRTFLSNYVIHPKDSVRAILECKPRTNVNSTGQLPTIRGKVCGTNTRPQFFEFLPEAVS
jgi:hypothetical protein